MSKIFLTMNFQAASGKPLAYGHVTFTLSTDAVVDDSQINAGRVVKFTLDANGNLIGFIWPNDQLTPPDTSYRVKAYTAEGQLCYVQDVYISTPVVAYYGFLLGEVIPQAGPGLIILDNGGLLLQG
jgi:hypothetical protein